MNIVRRAALGVLSPLFVLLLFATAFDVGLTHTVTHPAAVKKLAAESGIYDSIVPNLLRQSGDISTPIGNVSAADPAVVQAAGQVVSPQDVQRQTEAAIDSIYQWLDGKIAQPQFTIGLAGDSSGFAAQVSNALEQRLDGLPACSTAQDLAIARGGDFDVINADCLPRGVTGASVAAQVKSSIASDPDFLKNASISADSIKSASNCSLNSRPAPCEQLTQVKPFFEQTRVKNLPKQYQLAKRAPFILSTLTILTGAGIVFLSRNWMAGLRHIGVSLAVIGLVVLIFAWALNRTVNNNIIPKINSDSVVLGQDIRRLLSDSARRIDNNYRQLGVIYTLLGVGSVSAAEFYNRRSAAAAPINNQARR